MKFNTLRISDIARELNIKLGDIENGTKFRKASRMNFANEDELRNWLVENCKACQFDKFTYVLACGRKWKDRLMTLQDDGYDGDVMMYTATYEAKMSTIEPKPKDADIT